MTRGRNKETSIIEIHNLKALILELKALGYSYAEIIREVQTKRNIQISKSALTRFFSKHREIANKYKDDHSRAIGEYSIDISERIRDITDSNRKSMRDINNLLNKSSLNPNERVQFKGELHAIIDDLLDKYISIEHDNISLMTLLREDYNNLRLVR